MRHFLLFLLYFRYYPRLNVGLGIVMMPPEIVSNEKS